MLQKNLIGRQVHMRTASVGCSQLVMKSERSGGGRGNSSSLDPSQVSVTDKSVWAKDALNRGSECKQEGVIAFCFSLQQSGCLPEWNVDRDWHDQKLGQASQDFGILLVLEVSEP